MSAPTMLPRERLPLRHLLLYGWMPSALKKVAYRLLRGYRIGKRVKLGLGCAVIGDQVELADDVEIGLLAVVMGKSITIGRHSSIGTMSYVACRVIEIGEDAKIREQVFVGGPQLPESRFSLGSRTIVLQMAYINPTKPVVIGDDTGIGGHCLIFTHGAWLNVLDGYPVSYEPVTLGKSVWLPWRVFVMPGSTIGDGSVIGANSLVAGAIPPHSLAVGTPAKVVRSAPDFPRTLSAEGYAAKVTEMVGEFERLLASEHVTIAAEGASRRYTLAGHAWRLWWMRGDGAAPNPAPGDTVLTEPALDPGARALYRARGIYWLDLGGKTRSRDGSPLTEELAAFLSRYGIRLARDA